MSSKTRSILLALPLLCVALVAQAQRGDDDTPTVAAWKDTERASENTTYPRANVIPYGDENGIEKWQYDQSPFYIVLDDGMTRQSTGSPIPPRVNAIPHDGGQRTTYRRVFHTARDWKRYDVFLHVRGGATYEVYLNDTRVGFSQDSRLYSEFDITPYVKADADNTLEIRTYGTSVASLLEMQDNTCEGGLNAPVFLTLKNPINVADYALTTEYNTLSKAATLNVDMQVVNPRKKGQYYIEVELWDPKGKVFETMGKWTVFDRKSKNTVTIEREFMGAQPWTAETPNLYTAVIRLRDEDMQVLETVGTRFGFRSVRMSDGTLTVNGQPVTLRGMTYANGDADTERMRNDLAIMKQHNVNAIRTAYLSPANERFYELCDEYGFYVLCDANLMPYSDKSDAIATNADYEDLFAWRMTNMYEQLKNHTSIVAWGMGRGLDNGVCMEACYRTLRQKDATRPVVFAGAQFGANTDIVALSHMATDDLKAYVAKGTKRPLTLASFGSAQGNNLGGLERQWQLVRTHSSLQGGFFAAWRPVEYYDQAKGARVSVPGICEADGTPKPYLPELGNLYRPFGVRLVRVSQDAAEFAVTNWLDFLSLNDYTLEYSIFTNLKPRIIEGEVSVPLQPGETKNFKLKVPQLTLYAGEELWIRFTTRQRTETPMVARRTALCATECPLPMKEVSRQPEPAYAKTALQTDTSGGTLHLYNENIDLRYDTRTAHIVSYTHGGRSLLQASPTLSFWREPTDNDLADRNGSRLWQGLRPDEMTRTVVATNHHQLDASTVGVDAMLRYTDKQGRQLFDVKQSLLVTSSGDVLIDNEIVASEHVRAVPRVGLDIPLAEGFDTVQWMGLDKETYSDRRQSGRLGVYAQSLANMTYRYARPQAAGNRAEVRWMSATQGNEGLFIDMLDTLFNISVHGHTLHVDYRQAAIGSATAGVPVTDSEVLNEKKYHFRVHLRAYSRIDYAPQDFRRIAYPVPQSTVLPMPTITTDKERFDAPMLVSLSHATPGAELRYTLDGTEPTPSSPLYAKPFTISSTTVVKARAFRKGTTPSFTALRRFNFNYVTRAAFASNASTPYNYNQETILFDAETGDANDLSRAWLGFSGKGVDVTLTLGKAVSLQDVEVGFAHAPEAWVFAPTQVFVSVSSDGEHFSQPIAAKMHYDPSAQAMNQAQRITLRVEVNQPDVRYVRMEARALDKIPAWHKAKGLNPWVLIDEVTLNEAIK